MFAKKDVRFPAEGGIELSAWLFLPEHPKGRLPAITMAHGYAGTKYHGIERMAQAFAQAGFAADDRAQLRGEQPATQAIVSDDPAKAASYKAADAISFYLRPLPDGVWENEVTVRSTRWARMYAPGDFIECVSPTPLLMV